MSVKSSSTLILSAPKEPSFYYDCAYTAGCPKLSVTSGHTVFLFTCDMNRRKRGVESMSVEFIPSACTACSIRRRLGKIWNWIDYLMKRKSLDVTPLPVLLSVAYTILNTLKIKKVRFVKSRLFFSYYLPWGRAGCCTGNGEKLRNRWFYDASWLCLAAAKFLSISWSRISMDKYLAILAKMNWFINLTNHDSKSSQATS